MLESLFVAAALLAGEPPTVTVDRDNVEITESCRVRIVPDRIVDGDGNGVIHISADAIDVEFLEAPLHGARPDQAADTFTGTGVRITGSHVTLSGARISGYKVGIHAENAEGLTIHDCDVSGNFRQRLGSTPEREDADDWLWPHENDENQWIERYGAGLCIEDSENITVHDIRCRDGQNGIVLDRVNDSRVFDNDCSFLSGWGLAMWRSSRNVVSRNAFDFCVRGYSHGVYNRGQDSAGILMFEQCHDNLFADNSATHSGDGFFAFAGREALGEDGVGERDPEWFRGRGHTGNRLINNDFSYAVAHGIELTFSFENEIYANRLIENAICGIWGGYSQETRIAGNTFERNGDMAYGLERGGINIEHGRNNTISYNTFRGNACGIHLWWDNDERLLATPWAMANDPSSSDALIHDNSFSRDAIGVQLRRTKNTRVANNTFERVGQEFLLQEGSTIEEVMVAAMVFRTPEYLEPGTRTPVGARAHLRGRAHIIMGEWGPYDYERPLLHYVKTDGSPRGGKRLEYRVLGADAAPEIRVTVQPPTETRTTAFADPQTGNVEKVRISVPDARDSIRVLDVRWRFPGDEWTSDRRVIADASWSVKQFPSPCDPREDVETWRAAAADVEPIELPGIVFDYGSGGPERLDATDHFGTIATTRLTIPAGRWRLRTTSDDGIRVWMDDELVIDDWTWHAPTEHTHEFTVDEARAIGFRIEHFELDGYAVLRLAIEPAP